MVPSLSNVQFAFKPHIPDATIADNVSSAVVSTTTEGVAVLNDAPASGDYIIISASATATEGSVTTNAKCVSTEGYITASTKTLPITEAVTVGVTNATNKYIKIYAGEIVESTI